MLNISLKKYLFPYNKFLTEADFYKCNQCGFTFSKTVFEMDNSAWTLLNINFHSYFENPTTEIIINQPPYLQQALMLKVLIENHIIDEKDMLDYAEG